MEAQTSTPNPTPTPAFENIYEQIGGFGKFQKIYIGLLLISGRLSRSSLLSIRSSFHLGTFYGVFFLSSPLSGKIAIGSTFYLVFFLSGLLTIKSFFYQIILLFLSGHSFYHVIFLPGHLSISALLSIWSSEIPIRCARDDAFRVSLPPSVHHSVSPSVHSRPSPLQHLDVI